MFNSGIDYHALAHRTATRFFHIPAGSRIDTGQIQRCADHALSGGTDQGICLGMDTAAQLVPLAARHMKLLADAATDIGTVFPSARGAHIAGRDNLIVIHNHCPVVLSQTGTPLRNHFRQIQIIIDFISSFHIGSPFRFL